MSQQNKKVAVILSGCGNQDGAEIHESVLTLLALDREGASYQCFAPDIAQTRVMDHSRRQPLSESRNVLVESARIARGQIKALSEFNPNEFDALIIPGGLGAALNLSTYAMSGSDASVLPEVASAVIAMHQASKAIGAICIAPVILAKVLPAVTLTLGTAPEAIDNVQRMGAIHQATQPGEIVMDQANKVVTTPAYMHDSSISQVAQGIDQLVKAVLTMS